MKSMPLDAARFDSTPQDVVTFDTVAQLDALSSPFRVLLLECFRRPATAKEAADELGVPVTRLYYHLNALVDNGFLVVVEERRLGRLAQRVYRVTGKMFRPSRKFLESAGQEGLQSAAILVFRQAEAAMRTALQRELVAMKQSGKRDATLAFSNLRLSPDRLEELVGKLEDIVREYDADDGEVPVSFFFSAHRVG